MKSYSLLKGNAVFEKYIKKNFLKYIVILSIYLIGFLIGITLFNKYINNTENAINVSQYISEKIEGIGNENINIASGYLKQDFLELINMVVLSFSLIGVPIIIILFFIDSISMGITISGVIYSIGIGSGLSFSILMFLIPVLIKIISLLILICSSLKFAENILKYKKEIRYEIIRHACVCLAVLVGICIVMLYRTFALKIINQIF